MGHRIIVARPTDGSPVILPATAAVLFEAAQVWSTFADLDLALAGAFPAVSPEERRSALGELIELLIGEGILEQR